MSRGVVLVWPAFTWAALSLAITAGFGLGGALFAVTALHASVGLWWPAAAQAHGHIQVFGWAGLMVLGVGFHFLPRLRGAAGVGPVAAAAVLALLVSGLVGRALIQPLLAVAQAGSATAAVLHDLLVGSGILELAGASLALWILARLLGHGPPLRTRAGLWPVLPFFLTAFTAFWLALGANLLGLLTMASGSAGLVAPWADRLTLQLGFEGFLVPISVAMSERTFPLFFHTPLPSRRLLRCGLALLLVGLTLRVGGDLGEAAPAGGLGDIAVAIAFVLFVLGLGVFAPRRPLPREKVRPLADPAQLHALSAYLWLLAAVALLVVTGLGALGVGVPTLDTDAEHHVLGAGFVTLLILGVGARLLPGFGQRPLRSQALIWATLVLGNIAALLRVGPLFLPPAAASAAGSALLSLAGLAGLVALAVFGVNVLGRGSSRRHPA